MRKLLLILSLLIFVTTAQTCRQRGGDAVTVALPEKFTAFDTLTSTASDASAERVKNLIFNALVKKDENFRYVGELAKEFTTSEDGKTITFVLEDNVKFHNGAAFTSADVKYTFDELFKSNGYKAGAFFDTVPVDKADVQKPVATIPPANAANCRSCFWIDS
ncbi:MAG: ABC transporter substrate-binding protein [Pyrinomonadaceae bacterium]